MQFRFDGDRLAVRDTVRSLCARFDVVEESGSTTGVLAASVGFEKLCARLVTGAASS
jgi:hypothetical protein